MYLAVTTKGGREYASAARSVREGGRTRVTYTYLGRVVDREKGIYFTRELGYYTFDLETGEAGKVDEGFEPSEPEDGRRAKLHVLTFGDVWLLNELLHKSGFWAVVDAIPWKNRDTLHAMVAFYMCSTLANCHADQWWRTSVARLLWPKARLDSQGISEFLEKIGSRESILAFQKAYVKFVLKHYSDDTNVMIDSTGLPNKSSMFPARTNVHEGQVNVEARLIVVAQRSTSIQLYWQLSPGSVNDGMSFGRVLEHCEALGIHVDMCLLDSAYCTDVNLDELYDDDHVRRIAYVTRPKKNAGWLTEALPDALEGIGDAENFVRYGARFLFIRRVEVKVGKRRDQPAYLFVGVDVNRLSDELHKLLKRAKKKKLPIDKACQGLEDEGVFALVSSEPFGTDEILPEYYMRQGIEQLNDVAKGHAELLPVRCHTTETFSGHVLLSMVGNSVMRFMQVQLNDDEMYLSSRMEALRGQGCVLYKSKLVPDDPIQPANEVYGTFKIPVPTAVPIRDGVLSHTPPKMVPHLFRVPTPGRGKKKGGRLVATRIEGAGGDAAAAPEADGAAGGAGKEAGEVAQKDAIPCLEITPRN